MKRHPKKHGSRHGQPTRGARTRSTNAQISQKPEVLDRAADLELQRRDSDFDRSIGNQGR